MPELIETEGASPDAPATNGVAAPEPEPARKVLTAAQIRQAPPDCREEWLEVPEWGGWIRLRSPTALVAAQIKSVAVAFDAEGQTVGMDLPAMERVQVLYGVVEPVLTEEDVTAMQQRFGPSYQRVIDTLDALGGPLSKKGGEEELRKKAERTFRTG